MNLRCRLKAHRKEKKRKDDKRKIKNESKRKGDKKRSKLKEYALACKLI